MMVEVFWYQITSSELPFPTSRALTSLPAGNGALINSGNAAYTDPSFAGIYVRSNGLSGGNARWIIECTAEMTGKKFKAYVNFGNNWYVFEIQVWGPGSWTIENPGTGPAVPNQIIFGEVVPVFEDFPPNERDPNHPPPTFNPFEPIVTIEPQGTGSCNLMDRILVQLSEPVGVTITQVLVSRDGIPFSVSLADLLAGFVFTQAGRYEMLISFDYLGNPTQTLTAYFAVLGEPYPHLQLERTFGGTIFPQTPVVFDNVLLSNGSIENNTVNGQIEIYFCGIFLIKWFVVPQLGLTTDGLNFAIAVNGAHGPQGSGHSKVSSAVGFTVITVDSTPYTLRLINISDGDIALSDITQVTAGLIIAKIGDITAAEENDPASRIAQSANPNWKGAWGWLPI